MEALQNHEFVVGSAVAVILLSAFVASSLFRNIALALAAGSIVFLYVQGGIPSLVSFSRMMEKELLAIPDFSKGMMVGLAVAAVLLFGLWQRGARSS